MFGKNNDQDKAIKHEKKGDEFAAKGKFREALQEYQKSEALEARLSIYEKLTQTLQQIEDDWTEEDFSNSLAWTMQQQELQNPRLKWVHEKFSPEYLAVQKLLQKLMVVPTEDMEERLMKEIFSFEQKAILPALNFLLSIKKMTRENDEANLGSSNTHKTDLETLD